MKCILTGALLLMWSWTMPGASRDAEWNRVADALKKGLPRTAITNLEPIVAGAMKDESWAEAVKALGQRITLEAQVEGGRPDERIRRLEAELARAPKVMAPMLDNLLAHWYWQFFQQNRWRFMQRTAGGQPAGEDILTWDLPKIFGKIDEQFQKALAAEAWLKSVPVAEWDALLIKGTMPDAYRPTLYDFIAHQALEFYTAGEQAGARQGENFDVPAESPALDDAASFLRWTPATEAQPVPVNLRAIQLYQALLKFHLSDAPPRLAFAHADFERLRWAANVAYGEAKEARYRAALNRYIEEWADFEISALAREQLARQFMQANDLVAAREAALPGRQTFPDSPGGKLCGNVIVKIEARSLEITTEKVWNQPWPDIEVRYRNLQRVHFRALAYSWEEFLDRGRNRPDSLNQRERREVLAKAPVLEWSVELPPAVDYQEHVFKTPAPSTLKPGFYFVLASAEPSFTETGNHISLADVWVSDLALITRTRTGILEGFVLDATTGEPVNGAEVDTWFLDRATRVKGPPAKTDEAGFFSIKLINQRSYLVRARYKAREVATGYEVYLQDYYADPRPSARAVFFTDRALYRPGQAIQYKGICLWVDQEKNNYEVLRGEQVVAVFRDVNGNEIARQTHDANDFGSFAGSFTAPRDRLMGQMSIVAEGRPQGAAVVRVEEYKRPKFQVTLDAPQEAPKLKQTVRVRGHATSYTGAAIDNAQVSYRVTRQPRMPWWWGGLWQMPPYYSEAKEIAHGTLTTATDGSFAIEFTAQPDLRIPEQDDPRFEFQVHADVTDTAGETRSDNRSLVAGYSTLELVLAANGWQTAQSPVRIKVLAQTLDGDPQVVEAALKIHALEAPEEVQRGPLGSPYMPFDGGATGAGTNDLSKPENWREGALLAEKGFTTDTNGVALVPFDLKPGAYRVVVEGQDRFGKKVTGRMTVTVLDPEAKKLALKVPHLVTSPDWTVQPGEQFKILWGTGYDSGRACIEFEHRNETLRRFWTRPGETQQQIDLAITEAMRGGAVLRVTQVRDSRAYLLTQRIEVPWRNKEFDISWEHFVSKLEPGQKATWTAVIKPRIPGEIAKGAVEMAAALYDASLDAFAMHNWIRGFDVFRHEQPVSNAAYVNQPESFQHLLGSWVQKYEPVSITYRALPPELAATAWFRGRPLLARSAGRGGTELSMTVNKAIPIAAAPASDAAGMVSEAMSAPAEGNYAFLLGDLHKTGGKAEREPTPAEVAQVSPRKNLNETAFFYPQLSADSNGVVRMTFTVPEALTEWRFLGFAHDARLRSGYLDGKAVTSKDLMVQPNPPRFLREGDTVEFTVKISNQSDKPQTGTARLSFTDAWRNEPADQSLKLTQVGGAGKGTTDQPFEIPAKESRTLAWRLTVPDGMGLLVYRAVASSGPVSDGEEGAVPVLSRRVLVTESLAMPLRGAGSKTFDFAKLRASGDSDTLRHQSLTVQMVSQPAWYAVLALPYLMEFPHECAEQVFNRIYANALARHIANSDPRIRAVFDQWKNTPALDSPLEKNQELKSVVLEETPWVRQAAAESQARRNVGVLFDENRLTQELEAAFNKLTQMQLEDGAWPWFPGGRGNDYITLYIVTGFGRLRHLGLDLDVSPALRCLPRLDAWMSERYEEIQKSREPEKYTPGHTDALYLYGRSFFLKDAPIAQQHQAAVQFFLEQGRKHWLQSGSRQTQAHLALALRRFAQATSADDPVPAEIMRSLKERSVTNDELGRFWRDTEYSWWWYHAPIETQALMIEAFDEITNDREAVDDCRVWLLKQKQTQDWKTTKATADAVYALLLRGPSLLSSDTLVQVKLGSINVTPGESGELPSGVSVSAAEPGTGFYEVRFESSQIRPELAKITAVKSDPGVAWGSVHWQYLEDIAKVTPHTGTPLKLSKRLFRKVNTSRGPELQPVSDGVSVGDELVVRIELRVDRDMEFLHMKDQRGSGTEPVNVLSRYKFQDGLGYYESTRDTATHFFIDYLPKGVYVFEYSSRVQLRGAYQTGVTSIQCMYAPEFNSHSESVPLSVK